MADLGELNRCRLCSSQNSLNDMFGTPPNDELFRMIYACTSIRITFEKDFPCAVCSSCVRIVKQFYTYRKKCLDHDRELKRLRGEEDDEEDESTEDPLKADSKRAKKEARDRQFYEEVRKQIQVYLKTQVKEVERKALAKVDEALKKRKAKGKAAAEEVLLQMTVEPADEVGESVEYEVLNEEESEEFCQQQQQQQDEAAMDYKLELESVYFEASDNEDTAESSFAGFDEQAELKGPQRRAPAPAPVAARSDGGKKRKLSSDGGAAADLASQTMALEKQLTEAQRKIDTMMQLNFDLELKRLRLENAGNGGVISTRFTAEEDIMISVRELEEMNERSPSDSVFVGMLITRLIDPDNLKNMSVTGHASPRFAKLKKPDGSPLYPPTEKIDPRIFDFICNKVAERTAMRIGPDDIHTIRKNSDERIIKRFIAQKISNLKKADIAKRFRAEGGEPAWSETNTE